MNFFSTSLSSERIWFSLAPAVAITLFFLVSYLIYRLKYRRGDFPRFREIETRHASEILTRHFRTFLLWLIGPLERSLVRSRINPNTITTVSIILALVSGLLLAVGHFGLGGWVYVFSGICDVFDGRVARKTNHVTPAGGIIDSIADRYAEFFVFSGLAWFYSGAWILILVVFALFGSLMVSYVRAKAEALSIQCTVGRFQRAERLVYLGVGVALSPIPAVFLENTNPPTYWLAVMVLAFISIGANGTAVYRLAHVIRALNRSFIKGKPPATTTELPFNRKQQAAYNSAHNMTASALAGEIRNR